MIFKTFDSDSDKAFSKIGILGKSFEQIGASIRQRKIEIDNLMGAMSKKDAKAKVGNFWNYIFRNKPIKEKPIDLSKFIKLDEPKASNLLKFLQEIEIDSKTNTSAWQEYFSTLNDGQKWQIEFVKNNDLQKSSTEDLIKANQQARASALAHNEAIKAQTFSAKAGTVVLKGLATAGNMLAMWAISQGIAFAVEKIDNLIHSAEKCKERVNELMSSYKSALDKANSNAKTVEELAEKYETLSKGVNNLGENVSLTIDEYSEYNDIVNQIANMFPALIQGYTNEGNAILSLKGNVEQLRDAYTEAQQEAYNMLIISGKDSDGNDIITNWKNTLREDKGKGTNITRAIEELQTFITSDMDAEIYTSLREKATVGFYDGMTDAEALIAGSEFIPFKLKLDIDKDGIITDEELGKAKQSAKVLLQTYNAEIEIAFRNVKTLANAYLLTNEDYKKLDEQSQTAASLLLNSIAPTSSTANVLMTKTKEEVGEYVNSLVQTLSSDNPEVKNAIINLLTFDTEDMSPDKVKSLVDSYISTIADYLHQDRNDLKIQLGFGDVDNMAKNYASAMQKALDKYGGISAETYGNNPEDDLYYEEVRDKLTKFAEENSINTQDEIAFWNKCIEESDTREEAMGKYLESPFNNPDTPTFDLSTYQNQIDTYQSRMSTLKETLAELSRTGSVGNLIDLQQEFPELASTADSLDAALQELVDDELNALMEQLGGDVPYNIRRELEKLHDEALEAGNGILSLADSLNNLQANGDFLSGIRDRMNAGDFAGFTASELQEMISKFPYMENAVNAYLAGLISAKDVYAQLQDYYEVDKYNFIASNQAKMYENDIFYQSSMEANADRINQLAEKYNADFANFKTVAQAKAAVEKQLLADLSGEWSKYYKIVLGEDGVYKTQALYDEDSYDKQNDRFFIDMMDKATELDQFYKELAKSFQVPDLIKVDDASLKNLGIGVKDSTKTVEEKEEKEEQEKAEEFKKQYDWIEKFLDKLGKNANKLIDKAGKFISWAKKNAAINRAVKAVDKQITGQANAYAYYAENARKVGLNNVYIDKIQNGTLTIEDMQNEALSGKIEKYQEWYDKMMSCQDAINDLYEQERDLIRSKLDNVVSYYSDLDSYLSSIVSRTDSFVSLMDNMGKRSSLKDLLEQFATVNEQVGHFNSQTTTLTKNNTKTYLDASEKVADTQKKSQEERLESLTSQKTQAETGVQNTGTYKKLLKDIANAQLDYDKQYNKLTAIDPAKDKNGKKKETAQKQLDKLEAKLNALKDKRDNISANASANNIAQYSKIYDQYIELSNKQATLKEKGKNLSDKDSQKKNSLYKQMEDMRRQRDGVINDLANEIGLTDGSVADKTNAQKIQGQIDDISTALKESATYQKLLEDISAQKDKINKEEHKYDNKKASASQLKTQQNNLDKMNAQLNAFNEKRKQLEENATAATVGEYAKIYDAWRELQDKLDAGKVLTPADYKNYNKYNEQLKQFAEERASIINDLEKQLDKALNPGDKTTNINREYEEAADGIYKSYQNQIDNINKQMTSSKQYQDLLAKKQNLENKRDTKGLTTTQEETLKKYTEELKALEKGGTGDNIANYMKTWEQWYDLQLKRDSGKKLTPKESTNYDNWKAQLETWNNDKQTKINDLVALMEDDLEKLREQNAENIANAEAEISEYYSKVYVLAKQIAEYNVNALKEQLAYLDTYISYYKELVALYDTFSGDKLTKLLSDLDEEAMADQAKVYEKYLDTLQRKYDATLSEINEYKQLVDAVDTNDFQASMDLFQKAMDNYKATGNTAMADKLQSVLDLLNERAIDADNWEEYADLWMNEWEQALAEAKSGLIDTAGSIQDINDALREVRFSNITNALDELTRTSNILASMSDLIQDTWLYEGNGLSEYGKAKVALLVSQLENAQGTANEYLELLNQIQSNEDTYASDKAYQEALAEATQNYYASLSNAASIENTIVDLMKKAQEEELSNWKDIISARRDALNSKKSYYDYDRSIRSKNKNIEALKAEIAALNEVSTAEAKARKAKLEAELADAEQDLADTKMEHEYSISIDALDEFQKKLESALDDSGKSIQESLESQKEIIQQAQELYRTSTDSVNETMDKIAAFYSGMGMTIDGLDLSHDNSAGTYSTTGSSIAPNTLIPVEMPQLDAAMFDILANSIAPNVSGSYDMLRNLDNYRGGVPLEIVNHYDSLLHVDGNVDKDALPGLNDILKLSYEYTTENLYSELKKLGMHVD